MSNAARLTVAKEHISSHEERLNAVKLEALEREKKLLRSHEDTLERVFENIQKDLDAKQVS